MDDIRFHACGSRPSIVSISAAWLLIPGLFIAGMCQAIAAGENEPIIGYCAPCYSDSSWAHAAEHATASTWFQRGMGLDPMREQEWAAFEATDVVYVVDPYDGNIRYFTVQRSTYTDQSTREIEPRIEASPGTADPAITASLRQAFQTVRQFVDEMESGIYIGELDLGPIAGRIDSAIDLLGPDDGSAGYLRGNIQNILRVHYENAWQELIDSLEPAVAAFSGHMAASKHFSSTTLVPVRFDDGTSASLKIESFGPIVQLSADGGGQFSRLPPSTSITVLLELVEEMVKIPDLTGLVPYNGGSMMGLEYAGDSNIVDELRELAERYGIETEDFRAPEGDDESRFVCTRGRVMSEVRCTAGS